jgi:hypothetical protein
MIPARLIAAAPGVVAGLAVGQGRPADGQTKNHGGQGGEETIHGSSFTGDTAFVCLIREVSCLSAFLFGRREICDSISELFSRPEMVKYPQSPGCPPYLF